MKLERDSINDQVRDLSSAIDAMLEQSRGLPGRIRDAQKRHGDLCRMLAALPKED
jgi:hypothetical protein